MKSLQHDELGGTMVRFLKRSSSPEYSFGTEGGLDAGWRNRKKRKLCIEKIILG